MPIYHITSSTATTSTDYVTWTNYDDTQSANTATTAVYTNAYNYFQPVTYRAYRNYEAEQRRQGEIVRAHAEKAKKRAQGLLLEHLTSEQRETFKKNKWFVVEGGKSGKRYRIRAVDHLVANIDVLDGDKVAHRLCAHCDISAVPMGDHLLAQKVMLENSEDDFLRVANRHAA